jgi:hypothetical protein
MATKEDWRSLLALRVDVAMALALIWNGLGFYGVHLNGGRGRPLRQGSALVGAAAFGLIAAFFFAAVLSQSFRRKVTAESRRHRYSGRVLGFIGALLGFICLTALATGVGWLPRAP